MLYLHTFYVDVCLQPSKQDLEGFEEVKTKKKGSKKSTNREEFGAFDNQYSPRHAPVDNGKAPFGGRKVFIGGTADKDHDELRAHFSQVHVKTPCSIF